VDYLGLWGNSPGVGVTAGGGFYSPWGLGGQGSLTVDNCGNWWLTISVGVGTPGITWNGNVGSVNPSEGWGLSAGFNGGKGVSVGPGAGAATGGAFGSPNIGLGMPGVSANVTYTILVHAGHGCDKNNCNQNN